jgi:hypothetical protein
MLLGEKINVFINFLFFSIFYESNYKFIYLQHQNYKD